MNKIKNYFFLVFILLTSFATWAQKNQDKSHEAYGVLVKVENYKTIENAKLLNLLRKYKLKRKDYYKSFKIFNLNSKNKTDDKLLKSACAEILKVSGVKKCELDYKLKPNYECEPCVGVTCGQQALDDQLNTSNEISNKIGCILVEKEFVKTLPGLSKFWAQEYTGADLVREELIQYDTSKINDLIGVWDTNKDEHGEHVSNLIASSKRSALIPLKSPEQIQHIDLKRAGSYFETYEKNRQQCELRNKCPHYFNNSMSWFGTGLIREAVNELTNSGKDRVFVVSAGNHSTNLAKEDSGQQSSSRDGDIILVASHSFDGYRSRFSNYSDQIWISAPANNEITTYYNNGQEKTFGGTSAAAPQVTAALAAFTIVTGYKLNTEQSKTLLKNSAIKFYPTGSLAMGAGYLNSFKIHEVAKRIKAKCNDKKDLEMKRCVESLLNNVGTYEFSEDETLFDKVKNEFSYCNEQKVQQVGKICSEKELEFSCNKRKEVFRNLRKAIFLNPKNKQYLNYLSCIYKNEGFNHNADYYANLGKRASQTDEEFIAEESKKEIKKDKIYLMQEFEKLNRNKENILLMVRDDGSALMYVDDQFKNDREIVLEAIKQEGLSLQYASEGLQKDRDLILEAIKQNDFLIYTLDEKLKNDPEILLAVIKKDYLKIQEINDNLKNDPNFVKQAVKANYLSLYLLDKKFRQNKEIVLEAVKQDGLALKIADESLKNDREVVLEAVKNKGIALEFAVESLKKDQRIVLEAVKQDGSALKYADESFIKNPEIVMAAIKQNGKVLEIADLVFRNNREFVLAAVKQNAEAILFANAVFRNDREIILAAVNNDGRALSVANINLKKDREIVQAAVKRNIEALSFADPSLKKDPQIVLEAVKTSVYALLYADKELRKDRSFMLDAIKQNALAYSYLDPSLKTDRELALLAIDKDPTLFKYVDPSLQVDPEILKAAIE